MTDLVAAEFLKLRTTRTFWTIAGLSVLFVVVTTVAELASDLPDDEAGFSSLIAIAGIPALFMLILGAVSSAGEYRHGTITATFLVAPDRTRVLLAKSLAHGLAGIALAILSLLVILAIALPWLNGDGESLGSLGVGGSELLGDSAVQIAYVALTAMLAVGIGALLTNQVAALAVVPVILIVIDPLLTLLVDGYGKYSISGIWASLGGESGDDAGFDILSPLPAGLLYFGYVAAITAVTAAIDQRRDVS